MQTETVWLAPVLIEEAKMLETVSETPLMLFGGQSMKAGVFFDAVRTIRSKTR